MDLYSIASGSSGNCIYVGDQEEGILVDAGISMKRIREGLEQQGKTIEGTKGIFITHEHSDHVSGLGPILRKYEVPVFGTDKTLCALKDSGKLKNIDTDLFITVKKDTPVSVGNMEIVPFGISHDAADPVCYTITKSNKKVAVATDMGTYSDYTISHLENVKALLLEANHDINMLQVGSYPYYLKMRILGNSGHLSNDSSARLIGKLLHKNLQHIVLGHLSNENNYPKLAYETVKYELEQIPIWEELGATLMVAKRSEPSAVLTI